MIPYEDRSRKNEERYSKSVWKTSELEKKY